nr:hypothetical protein [Nocardioides daedukensis]
MVDAIEPPRVGDVAPFRALGDHFRHRHCVIDGETVVAGPGESIDVPTGAAHRITNEHSEALVISEVQHGAYTGEDDICRLEDDYGRRDEAIAV